MNIYNASSVQVPLGIELKSEQKMDEMVAILSIMCLLFQKMSFVK